jgi:hypothetical protein
VAPPHSQEVRVERLGPFFIPAVNLQKSNPDIPESVTSDIFAKKAKTFSGIRICRIARIQAIRFLIRAIRKIRILKALSCLVPALACLEHWQGRLVRVVMNESIKVD